LTAIGDTFFETLATTEQYRIRFSIKPGITGLAQVSGCRGAMRTREIAIKRLENDVRYVRELSFWLDMKVIMRTLVSEFLTGKAY
jgi:putative colanic acid biosynthesis UDP-glucose lipid carrier transferase